MNHANMNANETFLGLLEVQNEMQIACGKWTNFPRNECNSKCAFLRYFAITSRCLKITEKVSFNIASYASCSYEHYLCSSLAIRILLSNIVI